MPPSEDSFADVLLPRHGPADAYHASAQQPRLGQTQGVHFEHVCGFTCRTSRQNPIPPVAKEHFLSGWRDRLQPEHRNDSRNRGFELQIRVYFEPSRGAFIPLLKPWAFPRPSRKVYLVLFQQRYETRHRHCRLWLFDASLVHPVMKIRFSGVVTVGDKFLRRALG